MIVNERICYFDVAKGILILFLVMSHFGIALNHAGIDAENSFFLPWYYPQPLYIVFFMQCFFIISGFFSKFDLDARLFFKKLVKQLLIPWVFFEIVRVSFGASQGEFQNLFPAKEYSTLWFLNALLFAKLICWLINQSTKSKHIMLIVTFIFLLIGVILNQYSIGDNILYYKHGLMSSFFVAVGYFLKHKSNLYESLLKYSGILFVIIIAGRFLHYYNLPVQDATIDVTLSNVYVFILTSLSGSFGFLFLCKKIANNRFLEYFGRNSLIIYGLHMLPYVIIMGLARQWIGLSTQTHAIIFMIGTYFVELVAMILVIELLNIKYLRILVGKF